MKDKYAIILGGSSGLGLATAHKLSTSGYNICIVHRDRKNNLAFLSSEVEKMKSRGVNVFSLNKDALSPTTITEVCSKLPIKSVAVLVHSIAKGSLKPIYSKEDKTLTKQDFDLTIHAMGTSWLEWSQALIKNNLFTSNPRNIAFTSEGNTKVWEGYGAVSAAKVTLESLMRFMAVEYAPLGMTSNCIQAGMTQTPSFSMIPNSEKLVAFGKKRNPFKRLTTPEDVANAVYLLTRPEANWINGTILKVDGGESLR
ncbi:SDR family oxidoreductase [Patiriisocius hiemis]|uniref:SDR family oxidoreductase n=1 Tax=Patiriisocius hiemis TaxID=3075604 RepID=A0ABU2Y9H2_9FLAO|nr:SDR family oxidoreductase [Constantimarinum sp. W242]MDT0554825.1 SDR family oxidoreductase [Constantimarinum sp. W242]